MKIACVIHSLDGGGAERVMAELATQLADRSHHVTLITLDDGSRERHRVGSGVNRMRLNVMGENRGFTDAIIKNRQRIAALHRSLQSVQPDVALSFCDRTNVTTLLAARRTGIPVIVSERSDPQHQRLSRFWESVRTPTYRRAAAVIALTPRIADHLHHRLGRHVNVIPSAVSPAPVVSDRSVAVGARTIVGIGRLEHEKGFDRLIDAFANVGPAADSWSLRVLGEGSQRETLQQQRDRLGLRHRVTFLGWQDTIWPELSRATIFALPSRYEGFPSALLEAMAAGVPSIAVDCDSGPREIIEPDENGMLVQNTTSALTDGLKRMITDRTWRERLGQNAPQVTERFSWSSMVDQYEDILRRYSR